VSYQSSSQLSQDGTYQGRVIACSVEQAEVFTADARPDYVALAAAVMRGEADKSMAFIRISASGPGVGEKVDVGDGTIDQSLVSDADILALVQGNWQTVAGLFYDAEGNPPAA
jgi:hypothetical protein